MTLWQQPIRATYWMAEGVELFAFFPLMKSFWLLWSAFSVAARAKIPMHRSTDIIKLVLSVIFYLVSLGFSPKWIAMPKPHFQYSECSMFAGIYSYCSSLSTTFGKAWFFWNLKLFECATQITNVFRENIGQVWSVFVATDLSLWLQREFCLNKAEIKNGVWIRKSRVIVVLSKWSYEMQIADNSGARKNHSGMIPVLRWKMLVFSLAAQFAQPSVPGETGLLHLSVGATCG